MYELKVIGTVNVNGKEITHIEGGFGEDCRIITVRDVAIEHNMETKHVNELINRNIKRFKEGIDYIDLLSNESFKVVANDLGLIGSNHTKNVYLLSEKGYRKFLNITDYGKQNGKEVLKEYFGSDDFDCIVDFDENRKEVIFLNKLKETLLALNIKDGKNQYPVLSYRIDYYIPSLNIAIEYDENGHKDYTYERHEGRQKEIEKELGCRFVRVNDSKSDEYNIGLVIKEILI